MDFHQAAANLLSTLKYYGPLSEWYLVRPSPMVPISDREFGSHKIDDLLERLANEGKIHRVQTGPDSGGWDVIDLDDRFAAERLAWQQDVKAMREGRWQAETPDESSWTRHEWHSPYQMARCGGCAQWMPEDAACTCSNTP